MFKLSKNHNLYFVTTKTKSYTIYKINSNSFRCEQAQSFTDKQLNKIIKYLNKN